MANKPEILSTIRANGIAYGAGKEEELQAAISRETGESLLERKLIAGDWKWGGALPQAETPKIVKPPVK